MTAGAARPDLGARRLIRRAAQRVPVALAARLEEEWLAHLESVDSPWSGLRLALGCWWASAVIAQAHARDERQAPRPVAPVIRVGGSGVRFDERKLHYLSLRPVTLFLIVELQAALLCGLVLPL